MTPRRSRHIPIHPTMGGWWTSRKALVEARRRLGADAFAHGDVKARVYTVGVATQCNGEVPVVTAASWADCFVQLDATLTAEKRKGRTK